MIHFLSCRKLDCDLGVDLYGPDLARISLTEPVACRSNAFNALEIVDTDLLQSAMKLSLPSATGLVYGVRVIPATPQPSADSKPAGQNPKLKSPYTRYSVDFFIRATDVAFQLDPQGQRGGKIETGLMAYDRDGNAVNWDGVTQAMNLRPEAFGAMQKSGIPIHMEIDLPNEDVYLVTGVFDWGGGAS